MVTSFNFPASISFPLRGMSTYVFKKNKNIVGVICGIFEMLSRIFRHGSADRFHGIANQSFSRIEQGFVARRLIYNGSWQLHMCFHMGPDRCRLIPERNDLI